MRGNCNICILGEVFIQAFGFFKLQNYVKNKSQQLEKGSKTEMGRENSITSSIQQRQIVPPCRF